MRTPLVLFALAAFTLAGCGTTYVIQTKDGREFVATQRPDVSDNRYVQFVTKDGKKMMLKQDEVSTIREK